MDERFTRITPGKWRVKLNGVYLIKHIKSGKFYVGSTVDLQTRVIKHKTDLARGKHPNMFLQKAYNSHKQMEYYLYITETRDQAYDLEQEFLDKYHSTGEIFNIATDARSSFINQTEEARLKIAQVRAEQYPPVMRKRPKRKNKKWGWQKRRRKKKKL